MLARKIFMKMVKPFDRYLEKYHWYQEMMLQHLRDMVLSCEHFPLKFLYLADDFNVPDTVLFFLVLDALHSKAPHLYYRFEKVLTPDKLEERKSIFLEADQYFPGLTDALFFLDDKLQKRASKTMGDLKAVEQ